MPAFFIFIIYFVLALLLGAAIAYPLHQFLANWVDLDFDRVVSRSVLITAVILFFGLFKILKFSSWQEIGFSDNKKQFFSDLTKGIFFGVLIMAPVVVGLLLTQNRIFDVDWQASLENIVSLLLTALVAGLIVALLEETLFRGAMLTAIKNQSSFIFAIFSTSFIYALVHFLQPTIELSSDSLHWSSGFLLLKDALLTLTQVRHIFDSFIALFLAGILLALIRIRSNRIALCIGIHAGWVLVIKVFKRITDTNVYSDYAFLTGNYDKVIGYLAAICIAFFIILFLVIQNKKYN